MRSAETAAPGTGTLLSIQSLRGIAAMMVVWHHASALVPSSHGTASEWGTAGVDVFFVISGFVMVVSRKPGRSRRPRSCCIASCGSGRSMPCSRSR